MTSDSNFEDTSGDDDSAPDHVGKTTMGPKLDMTKNLVFGHLMEGDVDLWNKIKFDIFPTVLIDFGWNGKAASVPPEEWNGWEEVADKAGLKSRSMRRLGMDLHWGVLRALIHCDDEDVTTALRVTKPAQEQAETRPTTTRTRRQARGAAAEPQGDKALPDYSVAVNNVAIEVVGKVRKRRQRGKQQIQYQVHFPESPDEEDIFVDAASLRKDHPHGAAEIEAFEERERQAKSQSQSQKVTRKGRSRVGGSIGKGMSAAKALLSAEAEPGPIPSRGGRAAGRRRGNQRVVSEEEEDSDSYHSQPPKPEREAAKRLRRDNVTKASESEEGADFFKVLDVVRNKPGVGDTGGERKRRRDLPVGGAKPAAAGREGASGAATSVDQKKVFEVLHMYDAEVIKRAYQTLVLMEGI